MKAHLEDPMKDHPEAPRAAKMAFLGRKDAQIADRTGLSMDVVARWRTENWFQNLIIEVSDEALDEMQAMARGNIFDSLANGDEKIAKWVLERQDKRFFAPTKRVEISGDVNHNHRALSNLSDDELAQIIAENEPQPALEAEYDQFCLPDATSDEAEDVYEAELLSPEAEPYE